MKTRIKQLAEIFMVACLFFVCVPCAIAQSDPYPHRKELQHLAHLTLAHYFGNEPNADSDSVPLVDQIGEILGGVPDSELTLPNGKVFYSACRAHYCPEKASEVVDLNRKKILALGWIHYRCHFEYPNWEFGKRQVCELEPTLTIFVFRTKQSSADDVDITTAVERIKAWGQTGGSSYEVSYPAVGKIEIVDRFENQAKGTAK